MRTVPMVQRVLLVAMSAAPATGAVRRGLALAMVMKDVKMRSMTSGALQAKTAVRFVTCVYFPDHPRAEGVTDIGGLATTYFAIGTEGLVTICLMTGMVAAITSGANDVAETTAVRGRPFVSTAAASPPRPVGTGLARLSVVIVASMNVP